MIDDDDYMIIDEYWYIYNGYQYSWGYQWSLLMIIENCSYDDYYIYIIIYI